MITSQSTLAGSTLTGELSGYIFKTGIRMKKTMNTAVEMMDVVDKDDNVVGQATRTEVEDKLLRFRIVHVMLTNDVGNILVQWRKADKKVSPRTFTASAAGAVEAGESFDDAAVRELKEEMGVSLRKPKKLELLGTFQVNKGRVCNGVLYAAEWNGDVEGWEEEADALDFWSRDEAEYMLKRFPFLLSVSFQASLKLYLKVTK